MTTPRLGRRNPITLDVKVIYGRSRVVDTLRIEADPDWPGDLREHLLAAMLRKDDRGPMWIEQYELRVWRVGIDRSTTVHWRTVQFTKEKP